MDNKNPLNYVLPAGVLAYVASPEVRKGVRSVLVKGMAGTQPGGKAGQQASVPETASAVGLRCHAKRGPRAPLQRE